MNAGFLTLLAFAFLTVSISSASRLSDQYYARRYPSYYPSVNALPSVNLVRYNRPSLVDVNEEELSLYRGVDLDGDGLNDVVANPLLSRTSVAVDYDGDGLADYVQRRPNVLDYLPSRPIPSASVGVDYDGDGLVDYVQRPNPLLNYLPSRPIPSASVAVDYNGDGLADYVQHRPTAFDYLPSRPLPRTSVGVDVDGDGISDYVQRRHLPRGFRGLADAYSVLPDSTPYGARGLDLNGDGYADVSVTKPTPFGEFPQPLCARCKVAVRFEYCVSGLSQPCYPFLYASPEEICKKIGLHPRCEAVFENIHAAKQVLIIVGGPHAICSALNLC